MHKRGADSFAVVKWNRPPLHESVPGLPRRDIGLDHYERGRAHHRAGIRPLKAAAFAHLDHPQARQALQVVRRRRDLGTGTSHWVASKCRTRRLPRVMAGLRNLAIGIHRQDATPTSHAGAGVSFGAGHFAYGFAVMAQVTSPPVIMVACP